MSTVQIQIQEQKQKKRQLTFEEICPMWAEKIKSGNMLRQLHPRLMDMANASCCIVAEAHGWRYDYFINVDVCKSNGCGECTNYSIGFSNSPVTEHSIGLFVKHWNECHV